jgi:hypothetical protein
MILVFVRISFGTSFERRVERCGFEEAMRFGHWRLMARLLCRPAPIADKRDIFQLWHGLSILPLNYEDVWREWFLPTALGHLSSSPEY